MLHDPLPATSQTAAWDRVTAHFNQWRGACIAVFAEAEASVTATLLALGHTSGSLNLVGQRFDTLEGAIAADGALDGHGRAAIRKLTEFRSHLAFRAMLCHGAAQITLDRRGGWVVILRMTKLTATGGEPTILVLDVDSTKERGSRIEIDARALGCALGHIRKSATKVEAA